MRTINFGRPAACVAVAGIVALTVSPQSKAAQDPGNFIQALGAHAIQVAGPSVPEAQRTAIFRQLLAQDFDLRGAARFALGPVVRALTPEQQAQFVSLFRDSLAHAYSKRLAEYAGDPFRVTGERQVGGETVVSSEVMRRSGPPVRIDWHVVNRDSHLLVSDVDVDGVSQKGSERDQFAGIIARNGGRPEAVLAALRQQLAQETPALSGSTSQSLGPYRPISPPYR